MFLYSVLRWGNEQSEDGPDGYDTEFLVKALNVKDAGVLVDKIIQEKGFFGGRVQNFCHSAVEIGASSSKKEEGKVLFGPVISELSNFCDDGVPNEKKWIRDSVEEGWIEYLEYYE